MMNSAPAGRAFLRARRSLLYVSTILCSALAGPAFAQTDPTAPIPPDRQVIDPNGVNLAGGYINIADTAATIGAAGRGISYRRLSLGSRWFDETRYALYQGLSSSVLIAEVGRTSLTFDLSGTTWVNRDGSGATLVAGAPGAYTLTLRDGTVVQFTTSFFNQSADVFVYYGLGTKGVASTVTRPNGETLTFSYLQVTTGGGGRAGRQNSRLRLQGIKSSNGYAVKLTYVSNTFGSDLNWLAVSNAVLINLGNEYCDISANSCTLVNSWPTLTFGQTASGSNTITTTTDSLGRVAQYTFDSSSRPIAIRRPSSPVDDETMTYDANGRIASVTIDSRTWTYAFSLSGTVMTATITNPDSSQRVVVSDTTVGLPTSVTDELSHTTNYTYDTNGRLLTATHPEGNQLKNTYDGRGNLTERRMVAKPGSGLSDIVASASYDATCSNPVTCNQPNTTTDPKGNVTNYAYDPGHGGVLTVTAPAPSVGGVRPQTRYGYSSFQAYFNNGSGIVASGQATALLTSSSTCATTASCSGAADETKATVTYGPQVAGTANNLLPVGVTASAGDGSVSAVTAYSYDMVGNLTSEDGALPGSADTTTFRYDADRELVGVISADPDGAGALKRRAIRTTYNNDGLTSLVESGTVNSTSDADWSAFSSMQQVAITFDSSDRKAQVAVTAGGTTYALTQYSYDTEGRLDCSAVRMKPSTYGSLPSACTLTTSSGDADRITKMTYDNADRVTKVTSAYGTADASDEATTTFSVNGQIATATDANGNITSYTYDGFDRLSKINYPSITKGSGTSSATDYEQLGYDANSNVTSRLLRGGTLTINYTYDNLNRLQIKDLPGIEPDVTYGYDLLGRMTSAATSAQTLSLSYDALGRNLTQTGPLGTVGYQYDLAGRRTRLTWPDLFYVTYDYLVTGEMTTIKESGTTTLGTYAYDDLGRRTSLTRGNGVVTSYGYDNVSRLTSLASDLPGTTYDLTLGFGYNQASQITSTTRSNNLYSWTGATNVARNYTSNGLNQYSANTSTTFGYDARGNLTSSGSGTYTYSSENLLLTGPNSASLTYDPLMRLFQSSGATTTDTKDLYDGNQQIAMYITSTGALAQRYVMGPRPDEPLLVYKTGGVKYWVITDERGSTISDADSSGTPQVTNTYDEYGVPGASNALRMQYTGQVWLTELGMYYYKARMYSPTLGRFMQTDTIGYGDGINWYNYVGGDPINGADPSGRLMEWVGLTDGGGGGSGFAVPDIVINGCASGWSCITDPGQIDDFFRQWDQQNLERMNGNPDNQNKEDDIVVTGTRHQTADKPQVLPPGRFSFLHLFSDLLQSITEQDAEVAKDKAVKAAKKCSKGLGKVDYGKAAREGVVGGATDAGRELMKGAVETAAAPPAAEVTVPHAGAAAAVEGAKGFVRDSTVSVITQACGDE